MQKRKLSASAISTFLRSPRAYYWRYVASLETTVQSVQTFDHDKILGTVWSAAVDRFYKGVPEKVNTDTTINDWLRQTDGWVPPRTQTAYVNALENWLITYHQEFHPKDGVRNGSEKFVENDRFLGYLDGLSHDGKIIHECKSTKRAPQVAEQLWKVQHSIQVKLYAVLTQAEGVVIEFAWKDTPYGIFRAPMMPITKEMLQAWEQELNSIYDVIHSLGDDINNYPCNPDGCCLISKGFVAMCGYSSLCDLGYNEHTKIMYRSKTDRREEQFKS